MDRLFEGAIRALLDGGAYVEPITSATSPHSGFGATPERTFELSNWTATVDWGEPWFLRNAVRAAHLDQALGMAMWFLSASKDLGSVAFHNPNAATYSDDGHGIRAPWGHRLLTGGMSTSPVGRCIALLARDPSSLRAVAPVFGESDVGVESRDVPCLVALGFRVRGGRLHTTATLRSLNPFWVWPYDHVMLMLLHGVVAAELDVPCGPFTYVVWSLQVDAKDLDRCRDAVNCGPSPHERVVEPRPATQDLRWDAVTRAVAFEAAARAGRVRFDESADDRHQLSPFWIDAMVHLAWGRHRRGLGDRPVGEPPEWYCGGPA